jgi:hypothetical protein
MIQDQWPRRDRRDAASMSERSARDVVDEMYHRQQAGDESVLDDLVAEDMVNHAAGPQGRDGLRQILHTINDDLGPVTVEDRGALGVPRRHGTSRPSSNLTTHSIELAPAAGSENSGHVRPRRRNPLITAPILGRAAREHVERLVVASDVAKPPAVSLKSSLHRTPAGSHTNSVAAGMNGDMGYPAVEVTPVAKRDRGQQGRSATQAGARQGTVRGRCDTRRASTG